MTVTEAKELLISQMYYMSYRETGKSLHPSDRSRLFGDEHYPSDRPVYEDSPWNHNDEGLAELLVWVWQSASQSEKRKYQDAFMVVLHEGGYLADIVRKADQSCGFLKW